MVERISFSAYKLRKLVSRKPHVDFVRQAHQKARLLYMHDHSPMAGAAENLALASSVQSQYRENSGFHHSMVQIESVVTTARRRFEEFERDPQEYAACVALVKTALIANRRAHKLNATLERRRRAYHVKDRAIMDLITLRFKYGLDRLIRVGIQFHEWAPDDLNQASVLVVINDMNTHGFHIPLRQAEYLLLEFGYSTLTDFIPEWDFVDRSSIGQPPDEKMRERKIARL